MKRILKRFTIIKWILNFRREFSLIRFETLRQTRIQQAILKELLIQNYSKDNPLLKYEYQTFSQNGEDGIINEIFKRLSITKGEFIEIGTGGGSENNTRLLLELGWRGTWIDGNPNCLKSINNDFTHFISSKKLTAQLKIVDSDNINSILKENNSSPDVDLLSLDLDLTTHLVWESLTYITPKVLVIEYNGFFPKNTLWQAKIKDNQSWDGSINMGASLSSIIKISEDKNYKFIGTELSGTNAFFVHESLENHFSDFLNNCSHEPTRPYIVNGPAHRRD
tara:strand:- start:370 stop:1206 length:837 start_codon:yes stop_codon:yes gene_type:complete